MGADVLAASALSSFRYRKALQDRLSTPWSIRPGPAVGPAQMTLQVEGEA